MKWDAQTSICVNVRCPLSKNAVGYCPKHVGFKGNGRADRLAGTATIDKRLAFQNVGGVEKLEALPAGAKPGKSRHLYPGRQRRRKTSIGNSRETSERPGRARTGFSESTETILS